jgi:hypothetical protein
MKKIEKHSLLVKRLEEGDEESLRVIFESSKFGESCIETGRENFDLFFPGEKYTGVYSISGIPDFPGDKDEWKNICTISYYIQELLDKNGTIIYKKD